MIRIVFIFLHEMLSTGQGRGHGTKVGFFSRAHGGGGFPLFRGIRCGTSLNGKSVHNRQVVSWTVTVSTLRAQADIVQCLQPALEC